jgi:type VI secretion system protein ImpK
MTQQEQDLEKTVFHGAGEEDAGRELPPSIRPVAESGRPLPRQGVLYIAQQTSLEDYTPGLNPMVNAAANLLLSIVRIREESGFDDSTLLVSQGGSRVGVELSSMDMENLRIRLEAEVRGFEAQALAVDSDHSQVLAARYVLCTAVDEAVTTSSLGASGEWSKRALLSTFHNETWGGEKFYQILERCMQQPARNLYLLELMYLLLSLGFEGKYRLMDRGPIALESLRDKVYRQVRLLRGEPAQDLSKKVEPSAGRERSFAYIPLWLISAAVIFCVAVTFLGFSFTLDYHAKPLLQEFSQLASSVKGVQP